MSGLVFSQSVPSYVPTNGLVGWWGFNGNAQDGSGNGNHGTIVGSITNTTDRFGIPNSALFFNGNYCHIPIPTLNSLPYRPITYSAWVIVNSNFPISFGHKFRTIVGRNTAFVTDCGVIGFSSDGGTPQFHNTFAMWRGGVISGDVPTAALSPQLNTWVHVAFTHDLGGNWKWYVNGNITNQGNFTDSQNYFNEFRIGGCNNYTNHNGDCSWNDKLDDIGIWNRALTPQEITNLYNSQLPAQTSLCLPTITTSSPTSVGVDTVVIGGDISNDGGSSIVLRGMCYSTSPNPNMGNQRTEDGSGTGSFNTVLRGLASSTMYYARSYAKNSNGVVVYGNEVDFVTASSNSLLSIGMQYEGGIIFYLDSTGQHGLICAPNDQGSFQWGCYGTNIVGTSTGFGTGQVNTSFILAGCSTRPIATSVCDDLVLNGYSDWFLPSKDELQLMYSNLHVQGIGGFLNTEYYSSSQYSPTDAWVVHFGDGRMLDHYRLHNFQVRAVRAF